MSDASGNPIVFTADDAISDRKIEAGDKLRKDIRALLKGKIMENRDREVFFFVTKVMAAVEEYEEKVK